MKYIFALLILVLMVTLSVSVGDAQVKNNAQAIKKINEIDFDSLGTKYLRATDSLSTQYARARDSVKTVYVHSDSIRTLDVRWYRGSLPATPTTGFIMFVKSGGANTDTLYSLSKQGVLKVLAP